MTRLTRVRASVGAAVLLATLATASPALAQGRPAAGSVGHADGRTPAGQAVDGSDRNRGHECDANRGVGLGNPAHSGCGLVDGDGDGDGSWS